MSNGPEPFDAGLAAARKQLTAGRQALGLSHEDIATFLGAPVTVEYVRGMEQGTVDPSAALLARYLRAIGEELMWVLAGEVQTHALPELVADSERFSDRLMLECADGDPDSPLGKGFADDVRDGVILLGLVTRLHVAFRDPLALDLLARTSGVPRENLEGVLTHRIPATVEVLLRAYSAAGVPLRITTPSAELSRSFPLDGSTSTAAAMPSEPAGRVRAS